MGISSITVNLDVFIIVAIFVIGYFAGIITPPINFKKKSNPEDKMLQQLPEEDSANYYAWMWDDSEINMER